MYLFYFSRKEADELKLEVAKWRVAEAAAREKLLSITQHNQSIATSNTTTHAQHNLAQSSTRATAVSPPPVKFIYLFTKFDYVCYLFSF